MATRSATSSDETTSRQEARIAEYPVEELLGPLNALERLHAPKRLFVAGHHAWLSERPKVSIVGARTASNDGLKRAAKLARILVDHQVIVVSGLAEGVDTTAHLTTVKAGGRTIAVIGTSLAEAYPARNRELQAQLMRDHLVVSQFPRAGRVTRGHFPMRNRTMALIADASVIVEAGDRSGSLSHGWEALRLGRPLFLMASILENRKLSWPKAMLDFGAMVLEDPADLLDSVPSPAGDPLSAIA